MCHDNTKKIIAAYTFLDKLYKSRKLPRDSRTASPPPTGTHGPTVSDSVPTGVAVPVISSYIEYARYDGIQRILWLKYKRGGEYGFEGVPEEVFREFLNASSKGKFAYQHIYGKFRER